MDNSFVNLESPNETPASASITSTPCRLVVESGEAKGEVFSLKGKRLTVGRGPENTIQIVDTRASRRHFTLEQREKSWFVSDLESKNGTFVNDKPIASPVRLVSGDRIRFGDTVIVFENEYAQTTDSGVDGERTGIKMIADDPGLESSHYIEVASQASGFSAPLNKGAWAHEDRLKSLYQVAGLVQSILDLDELLEKFMDVIERVLQPSHAAILLHDEKLGRLEPRAVRRTDGVQEDIRISSSIVENSLEKRAGVLMQDPLNDGRFGETESIVRNRIRSAICAPLVSRDRVFGALYLDARQDQASYTQEDLEWVVGVATQAAWGIDSAYMHAAALKKREDERELEIAREIQMNLLPRTMPKLRGFGFGGFSEPAQQVGGDYFDITILPDGSVALTIADVSGKGIPAAILVASIRAAVRMEARSLPHDGAEAVMQRLNEIVYEETMSHMFISMVLAHLDPSTRTMTVANAGHNAPLIRLPDGELISIDAGGCFLGIEPGQFFEQRTLELPVGSSALFFTDGITDAVNDAGDRFGTDRLTDFFQTHHELPAPRLCDELRARMNAFRGKAEPFDDMTALAFKTL